MMTDPVLAGTLATVLPHLNERQRRLLLAAAARARGSGGISQVARAAGVSRQTVHTARHARARPDLAGRRGRRPGGGRTAAPTDDPALLTDLEALVDPDTRGDPTSPWRWTGQSTRQLATALAVRGHQVSPPTVAALLHAADDRLQAPVTTLEGTPHPDRAAQFRSLTDQTNAFRARGWPVVAVDPKTQALVGTFTNGGRAWPPTGQPAHVNVHDFPAPVGGKAMPYGISEVGRTAGWVRVGRDHATACFAVASLADALQRGGDGRAQGCPAQRSTADR